FLLLERGGRAGFDTHEPEIRAEQFDGRPIAVLAGEHVDFIAEGGELAREFEDVDVEPARDTAAEGREGAGVIGDLRDSLHGYPILPDRLSESRRQGEWRYGRVQALRRRRVSAPSTSATIVT